MLRSWLPTWALQYQKSWLNGDLGAGLIVTIMLIPQSLAYAMLAGLPPQMGMYASIAPLLAYALLGSSMSLAVGPVAVVSLMTATALAPLASPGSPEYANLAILLALLSGIMLLLFGLLRLGALANLLSHPVIAGFINGSALLITIGQLKPLLGMEYSAQGGLAQLYAFVTHLHTVAPYTAAIGITALVCLWLARRLLKGTAARLAPMLVVVAGILWLALLRWDATAGVKIVGAVPAGLPSLHWALPQWGDVRALLLPALLLSLVGMVESISVARSLAHKKKQRIDANKELLGLGAANLASAISGGYPVTGGFARSVVNFSAGANTPLAGVISAVLMSLVLLGATSWFYYLPQAILAATIIIAVTGLLDFSALRMAWRFDRGDALAFVATLLGVLVLGVEEGIVLGVVLSLVTMVYRTSRPHVASLGLMPGTEHFRNTDRHPEAQPLPGTLILRVDENFYFGNASAIESCIQERLAQQGQIQHLVLVMSAVNRIDLTGLEMLEDLYHNLKTQGKQLHLTEVKGPVMDALGTQTLAHHIKDRIWLSTYAAYQALAARQPEPGSAVTV